MLRKYNKTAYFVLFREFHKWFSPPFDKFAVNLNSRIDNIDYEHCQFSNLWMNFEKRYKLFLYKYNDFFNYQERYYLNMTVFNIWIVALLFS